jgi:hypothetical protein
MNRMILGIIFALGFTACAPKIYTHPTKSSYDFDRDKYECEQAASQYSANWGAPGNPFIIAEQIQRCLELKFGWVPQR